MPHKTHRMLSLEERFGKTIAGIVLATLNTEGTLTLAAKKLGVSKAVLVYWCLSLGIQKETRWVKYKMVKENA